MADILECDIGNTCCKWRIVNREVVIMSGSFHHNQGFGELIKIAKHVSRVRFASVAGAGVIDGFMQVIASLGVPASRAVTRKEDGGVVNSYADPLRMGVDRWLAVIAAYHRHESAAMIIDAGSALTVDLVNSAGLHLGGYIVPGERLMRASLLSATGEVRFSEDARASSLELGCSTDEAVYAGVLAAQCGVVQVAVEQCDLVLVDGYRMFLAGGAAQNLLNVLPASVLERVELDPDLVLDGLRWVMP